MIEVRILGPDEVRVLERVAQGVFDEPVNADWATELLRDPRHHLAVALDGDLVVGFASGVTYLHPDKPLELYVHEVGVAESHRGRGIGGRVLDGLLEHGRRLGCREAWVLTEPSNEAANRLYASAHGAPSSEEIVMYTFSLGASDERP